MKTLSMSKGDKLTIEKIDHTPFIFVGVAIKRPGMFSLRRDP